MNTHWQGAIDIAAPVDVVYRYLAVLPNHCELAQTLDHMDQLRPGNTQGVGAVYRTHERQAMQADRAPRGPLPTKGFRGTTECEVAELSPNHRIAWRAHPVPVGFGTRAELDFDLEPIGDGSPHLSQTIVMRQSNLALQLFSRLVFHTNPDGMEVKAKAQWQASLANIKAILEADAAEGGPR